MDPNEKAPHENDDQRIDKADHEAEELQLEDKEKAAQKDELDGPANDLIGQPAPKDNDEEEKD